MGTSFSSWVNRGFILVGDGDGFAPHGRVLAYGHVAETSSSPKAEAIFVEIKPSLSEQTLTIPDALPKRGHMISFDRTAKYLVTCTSSPFCALGFQRP